MNPEVNFLERTLTDEDRNAFRYWLQRQLTERCKKNPLYSLRSFAKFLAMDPSSLSQILSGKRSLSKKTILAISTRLTITPEDWLSLGFASSGDADLANYFQVNLDTFAVISDWYHYAILELTFVEGFSAEPAWISKKLSISTSEATLAVERLLRLGLLANAGESLVKTEKLITNRANVNTSDAHRELQRQVIAKALDAIDDCEPFQKDITSMTMAIDPKKLDQARELTRRYRREMCALLEEGTQTEVYNLTIQLYPVTPSSVKKPEFP